MTHDTPPPMTDAERRVLDRESILALIDKFPHFDSKWAPEAQEAWWRCYFKLAELVFDCDVAATPAGTRALGER